MDKLASMTELEIVSLRREHLIKLSKIYREQQNTLDLLEWKSKRKYLKARDRILNLTSNPNHANVEGVTMALESNEVVPLYRPIGHDSLLNIPDVQLQNTERGMSLDSFKAYRKKMDEIHRDKHGLSKCMVCSNLSLPLPSYCFLHILKDEGQCLYKKCNGCDKPVLISQDPSVCELCLPFDKAPLLVNAVNALAEPTNPGAAKLDENKGIVE